MTVLHFDRIGRHHNVAPLQVPDDATDDAIADAVMHYVLPRLGSRDVSIGVDVDDLTGRVDGSIYCGVRMGGNFTSAVAL